MNKIEKALRHVASIYPGVTMVEFDEEGRWTYRDEDGSWPAFRKGDGIDLGLLEDAADVAPWPSVYKLSDFDTPN